LHDNQKEKAREILSELHNQYVDWMPRAGLSVRTAADITAKIALTWEYCSRMAQRWPMRWLTPFTDAPTRRFVKSFPLMSEAYATGAMAFGLLVATPRNHNRNRPR
jgi:hypothetical protein